MSGNFSRKILEGQGVQDRNRKNPIDSNSANAVEPSQVTNNISGDYVAGDRYEGDNISQNNRDNAKGSQNIIRGGEVYINSTIVNNFRNHTNDGLPSNDLSAQIYKSNVPDRIFRLTIVMVDDESYNVIVAYRYCGNIKTDSFPLSINKLKPLLENQLSIFNLEGSPENIYGKLDRNNEEIKKCWSIRKTLESLKEWDYIECDDGVLEIIEYDEIFIPWESIKIAETPLGCKTQIVRQDTDIADSSNYDSNHENHFCQGKILAYQRNITRTWQNTYHISSCSDFSKFIDNFHQNEVVYAFISIDGFSCTIPIDRDPTGSIQSSRALRMCSNVILVSGKLSFSESVALKHHKLLKIFHISRANGVIGSLKSMQGTIAEEVMDNFFHLLEERGNIRLTIPAMLREMRVRASERLTESNDTRTHDIYLATFSYIYYGNPFTTLQLERQDL